MEVFRYAIDRFDILTDVDDEWERFAAENGAPDLTRDSVVGRSIFSFIAGSETRQIYRELFVRARHNPAPIVIPFRCDAPAIRRDMTLEVIGNSIGDIELTGRLLSAEAREAVAALGDVARSDEIVRMCSWCKRVDIEGNWVDLEVATRELSLFASYPLPRFSHGICTRCTAEFGD
ncbi:MAG: hypothetical protein KDI19_13965 [Pseudomonadales bacterium]|nr:hypothetical protein [Pseudomonadales bacterium]